MLNSRDSMGIQDQTTKYVTSVGWTMTGNDAGDVTVTLSADPGLGTAAGTTIILRAAGVGGRVGWTCGKGTINQKYLPSSCKDF